MALPTAVNSQITDAVTQANTQVLGDSPAIAMGNLFTATAQAVGNAAHDATNNQQQSSVTAQAATTQGVTTLLSLDTAASGLAGEKIVSSHPQKNMCALDVVSPSAVYDSSEPERLLPTSFRLPVNFDPVLLRKDLSGIVAADFIPHFNTRYYEGDWSVVPLRSIGGRADQIYPDPTRSDFEDTPLLERCPYVAEVLSYFRCPKLAVRFLRVRPRSVVKEHRDYKLRFEDGEVRLHIPVTTNPEVRFVVAGKRVIMAPGECWYNDFTELHSVHNDGDGDRVHLTIDCVVNDWLHAGLLAAARDGTPLPA